MRISEFLDAADVIRLASPDKTQLLRTLSHHAASRLDLDAAATNRSLTEREALGSTGVGGGVALPHARLGNLPRPFGLFAALARPIEFGAVDDQPVDLVFLLLLPSDVPEHQLRCLACVARRLKEPGLVGTLRAEPEPARLYWHLVED